MIAPLLPPGCARFLGLRFDLFNQEAAIEKIYALARMDTFSYGVTPNVDHLVRLHGKPSNIDLWTAYREATICLCDSRILKALASLSGIKLTLVPGSDLTAEILTRASQPLGALVIGGDSALLARLRILYPDVEWHHHAPPYGLAVNTEAQCAVVDVVERSSAQLIFFAIGSPQSELICASLAVRERAKGVALCVGASLEFLTGAKRRAPRWIQRAHLEWLFRLMSEPTRLWRRYLVDGPVIFWYWWRWLISASR